ncbi:MAG: multicopper oxidase domain-containing protein [Micromonosporaceae bacterium]|nr:multicopper oxidase domain-containing protein [Micromonosporaceae bacterium]
MTRRRTLAGAAVATVAAGLITACDFGSATPVTVPATFDRQLTIPPLADSRVTDDGTRVFQLSAQRGRMEFLPGRTTATWGYNGDYLGPTLRAARGERVAIEFTNDLPEATTVHWHGMHLPAAMDGGPHQMVEPGETWRPTWTIDQPAATLWYHPHPHGETEKHVYRGLAGMFIVDDADSSATGLPSRYGVDDIPVIVQDKDFGSDGELVLENDGNEIGLLGSNVLVNGTIGPYQTVSTESVRLRLLNGSTARTYNFGFDDNRSFHLVGTDGGLLAEPYETDRIRLSPGERAEIVVRIRPGTTTRLRSYQPDLGSVVAGFAFGGNDSFDVLELRAAEKLQPAPEVPAKLPGGQRIDPTQASAHRSFELEGRKINGRRMDMTRIDQVVGVDTTEIWHVRNRNPFPHNFHVHDVQFEVLSIDGAPPPPELAGRKDTVYLEPRREYQLVLRFEDYADSKAPYMYHCHLLLHEDDGMMGQFIVVDDAAAGQALRAPGGSGSHRHHHAGHG